MARSRVRKSARKLSARDLIAAAPILLIGAVAFVVVLQVSVAGEFRAQMPQLALKFAPFDAEARARLAATLASNNPLPEARQAARDLARDAIRRDPLNPIALRALGLASATETPSPGAQAQAAELFGQAEHLSRRDQVTQLWLAEHYLKRGQIPLVMRHFDIALRTSGSGEETLFPLLAAAAVDQRVADAIIVRMRQKPQWKVPFAIHLVSAQAPADTRSYILRSTLDSDIPEEMAVIEAMMQRLANTGDYRLARQIYDHFRLADGKTRNLVNDGGFDSGKAVPPFAWTYLQEPDLWAAPEQASTGGRSLMLSASNGRSGDLARQLVELPAGTYRLTAKFGNVPLEAYQRPTLNVRCADGDEAVLVTTRPASSDRSPSVEADFSVPATCGFQWLAISLSGPESEIAEQPWIDDVVIARVGR